ncbi:MAG: hypothetical protein HOI41_04550 [Acidimicrobiaceae bacterium]|jgi:hypothetical protein|nr:hypothetical protein [Acidimicrobiaceae bacterium]
MGVGYQIQDREIIDYELWSISGGNANLRGPRPVFADRPYIVFTGAAQTFGRFVEKPFAEQVGKLLEMPALNLGLSGAGPEVFLQSEELKGVIAGAELHFCQVLSARSVSAGLFECQKNNGVLKFLAGKRAGEIMLAAQAFAVLRDEYGETAYREQIEASQRAWVERYRKLLSARKSPTYLLWISTQPIGHVGESVGEGSPVGEFPHFVTPTMIDEISSDTNGVIDCAFTEMRPQPLRSSRTGHLTNAWRHIEFPGRAEHTRSFNVYYATPEHHELVVARVLRTLSGDERLTNRLDT